MCIIHKGKVTNGMEYDVTLTMILKVKCCFHKDCEIVYAIKITHNFKSQWIEPYPP